MSGGPQFPPNPTVGQIYTFGTTSWQWNGTQWVNATAGQNFLPLAGGTMQGPIVLSGNGTAPLNPVSLQQWQTGVTDGSNAAVGQVGEVVVGNVSNTLGTSGSWLAGLNMALSAGDWDASAEVSFFVGAGNTVTGWICGLSASNAAPATGNPVEGIQLTSGNLGPANFSLGPMRFSSASPQTVWLMVYAAYTGSTANPVNIALRARRMR